MWYERIGNWRWNRSSRVLLHSRWKHARQVFGIILFKSLYILLLFIVNCLLDDISTSSVKEIFNFLGIHEYLSRASIIDNKKRMLKGTKLTLSTFQSKPFLLVISVRSYQKVFFHLSSIPPRNLVLIVQVLFPFPPWKTKYTSLSS